MQRTSGFIVAAILCAGCASVQVPPERFAKAEASIRGAEEVGAPNVPKARLYLQYARDQAEQAKVLSAQGDDRADTLLARAEADAELALELAREETLRVEAQRAMDEVKALQGRTGP
jgi:hypothetical protein